MTDESIPLAVEAQRRMTSNVAMLLNQVGDRGLCKGTAGVSGCSQTIWWVMHKNGKRAPYDADAQSHWATCPAAAAIRAAQKAQKDNERTKGFGG